MLNKSGESGHPYLIPDFRGNGFSFLPSSMMAAIGFIYSLYIPSFLRAFIMKWCWIFPKAFSRSIEIIKWFLSLLLLMCCITFIDLYMLNHPCIPEMKPTWSWWMIFLVCCWIQFAIILLRIFISSSLRRLAYSSSFGCVLVQFWNECNTGSLEWVTQCSFPFCFMEKFKQWWC
jgi:hypothetical protein